MGWLPPSSSLPKSFIAEPEPEVFALEWPFGKIESLRQDELRETAYELFFASCRSSPGFGGRNPISYFSGSCNEEGGVGKGNGAGGGNVAVMSRIKRGLGLKMRKVSPPLRVVREVGNVGVGSPRQVRQRPMTCAEIMRQQMGVTEQRDARLRKTLMKTLVGQTGRRAETIVLPFELLRHLKPSEFTDISEYHQWQRRQLKVLEAGLISYPSMPLDGLNPSVLHFQEVIHLSEHKPIEATKNSEVMRKLCQAIATLAWHGDSTNPSESTDACHWADGYPLNILLYLTLLHSVFDLHEETIVLDEVDELIELMKKTWPTLGINRMIHNICFTWALFEQYVTTRQTEPELMNAALGMLGEVAHDAKRMDSDLEYVRILSVFLTSMKRWAEKKLMHYHEAFDKGKTGVMESVLTLALSIVKIITVSIPSLRGGVVMERDSGLVLDLLENLVDQYIRSSVNSAFTKVVRESRVTETMVAKVTEDPNKFIIQLARETEMLAICEKESFSQVLKRWHPAPVAVAVVTVHNCFGEELKQYMARITTLTDESTRVLQTAGKLEKALIQMVVEDSVDCDDGGKAIVREMVPYEVDIVILNLMKAWIAERLRIGRECLARAKETESWNPKSKSEPYAQSAVDLMNLVNATVDEFFKISVTFGADLVQDLADGLETLFQEYCSFVSCCGSKQSYIPTLPPLTRCNQDSKFIRLWKSTTPCVAFTTTTVNTLPAIISSATTSPTVTSHGDGRCSPTRPSTSRGTQRLYVRLNTLHFLLSCLHSLDKSLSFFSPSPVSASTTLITATSHHHHHHHQSRKVGPTFFDLARSSIQSAILHVSRVSAYRLIFNDLSAYLYDGLYAYSVRESRIRPCLRVLRQNLTLLFAVLTHRAQSLAVREVMKAAFEAFLMVLLAGGSIRAFQMEDYDMIVEDFESLKSVFCDIGEGLVAEEVVQREGEVVEAIIVLMGTATDRLIEDFTTVACEASGFGVGMGTTGSGGLGRIGGGGMAVKVPMPPTTGRWNRSDPNTVLRVLCHRDDELASCFLKKTFQLPKRR